MPKPKIRRWLYGDELMKRWNASPLDIWALMIEGKLIPYNTYTFSRMYATNDFSFRGVKSGIERDGIKDLGFKLEDIELFEKEHNPQEKDKHEKEIKLLPSQRHKEACRAIAKKLWEINPNITIEEMAYRDEINEVCEGKVYSPKTIRNWIKDLCPNREPGRRPKPKV